MRGWIGDVVVPARETWVMEEADGSLAGFMALESEGIDQLYLRPDRTGLGIGSELMALAKARRPEGLSLYTFQVNAGARRFYERHGFVVAALGDGSGNEEGQPDVRYEWRPGVSGMSASHPDEER